MLSNREKFKCNVCSAKCRISMVLEMEDQCPVQCLHDAFEPIWVREGSA
jgi:hypothetical protein